MCALGKLLSKLQSVGFFSTVIGVVDPLPATSRRVAVPQAESWEASRLGLCWRR